MSPVSELVRSIDDVLGVECADQIEKEQGDEEVVESEMEERDAEDVHGSDSSIDVDGMDDENVFKFKQETENREDDCFDD